MLGMIAVLAACTVALGPKAMFLLYVLPYWGGVVWLDIVTYLHHHGTDNPDEHVPWYRGEVSTLLVSIFMQPRFCLPGYLSVATDTLKRQC